MAFFTALTLFYINLLYVVINENINLQTHKMHFVKNGLKVIHFDIEYLLTLFKEYKSSFIFDTDDLSSYELVTFTSNDLSLDIRISPDHQTAWMNHAEIAELFNSTIPNISIHISNIFERCELEKVSVVKFSLITGNDGKTYNVDYYNLDMILAIGYRVNF